jgi:hypothetical protein
MTQAAMRAAAVELLEQYRSDAGIFLQVWPGRVSDIRTPTAFVDAIRETIAYPGMTLVQRTPQVDVVVLHGYFDSKDTVAKRDAFCDGFLAWVIPRFHAAGANTLTAIVSMDDDPDYEATWSQKEPRVYYATRIVLEGYAEET